MSLFGFANQLVGFVLGHLAAADHVLDQVTRAFDGEAREACGGIDDVFHRSRHLAACLETDLVRTSSHLGDGVADVLTAMSGATARRSWCRG